jgi:acyl carrier protein
MTTRRHSPEVWSLAAGTEKNLLLENSVQTEIEPSVKETLRQFILRSIHIADLSDDDDLFELGIANSLFAIQLMTFIEKTFALEVETQDLDIDNFRSISASTAFVMKKQSSAQYLDVQASRRP